MSITAALALALVWGCQAPAKPSLLLVTLDTTRADHIGAYGSTQAHTPTIDALAEQGLRLEYAYGTAPLTIPSHASMMTGLYPPHHGVRTNGDSVLAPSFDTLAERLHAAGYRTAASVSAFVTTRAWGFNQGFDDYFDAVPPRATAVVRWALERPADQVVADAESWLKQGDGPYFLWVHFYDAHEPYAPPEPYASQFAQSPYDGELAWIDAQLSQLMPVATAAAGPGGLHVIALGDHGEALGDVRGEHTHGTFLAEATTRVPFIVRPAKPFAKARVEQSFAASVADVMPTALGLLGLPVPEGLDGEDLSPLLRGEAVARKGVYLESYAAAQRFGYHPEIAWIELPFKLLDTPHVRLWDLRQDPAEARDIAATHAADVARLQSALAPLAALRPPSGSGAVAPEIAAQLAALGYVSGEIHWGELDLRDHLDTVEALDLTRVLISEADARGEQPAEAEAMLRKLIEAEPQLREARFELAGLLERRGDLPGAEALFLAAIAEEADATTARMSYAQLLTRDRRYDEALAQTLAVLGQVPTDEAARVETLQLLAVLGREDELVTRALAWQADGSLTPPAAALPALALAQRGDPGSAELLAFALSDGVARPGIQLALGLLSLADGDTELGINWLRGELDTWPQNAEARRALAGTLMSAGDWEEAEAEYRYLSEAYPEDVDLRCSQAQAAFNTADYERAREVLAPALKMAPDNPRILMLQANILGRTGDMAGGQAMAERARELAALQPPEAP